VTAFEAKTRFGEMLERVARGEEIVITRHEKPVARLVAEGGRDQRKVAVAVAGLKALRERIAKRTKGKAVLSDAEVRAAIEEGRL
jgi:antitoxin (DNA-binding transcriptional repressor) of toxin-antitoxin stability system